jgi:hypothetical protein
MICHVACWFLLGCISAVAEELILLGFSWFGQWRGRGGGHTLTNLPPFSNRLEVEIGVAADRWLTRGGAGLQACGSAEEETSFSR